MFRAATLWPNFAPDNINMQSILVLGESGEILGNPPGTPKFNIHCFDQQPLFTQLELRQNPPFSLVQDALDQDLSEKRSVNSN